MQRDSIDLPPLSLEILPRRTVDDDEDDIAVAEGKSLLPQSGHEMKTIGEPGFKRRPNRRRRRRRMDMATGIPRNSKILGLTFLAIAFVVFLVIPAFLPQKSHHNVGMPVGHDVRLSNGTHTFRKTVLMVSIDGFR